MLRHGNGNVQDLGTSPNNRHLDLQAHVPNQKKGASPAKIDSFAAHSSSHSCGTKNLLHIMSSMTRLGIVFEHLQLRHVNEINCDNLCNRHLGPVESCLCAPAFGWVATQARSNLICTGQLPQSLIQDAAYIFAP